MAFHGFAAPAGNRSQQSAADAPTATGQALQNVVHAICTMVAGHPLDQHHHRHLPQKLQRDRSGCVVP